MDEVDNLKYNLVKCVASTEDFGIAYIRDEAKIRFTVENADAGNILRVEGRLIGQSTWVTLLDVTGTDSQVLDVSTYEEIKVGIFAYDSLTIHVLVYASSFDNVSSGGSSFSGDYNDLINIPIFDDVATSGDYGDLINTPTIPVVNDSITNGNTTSSPSENAVFDALALKSPNITAKDEGSTLTTAMTSINFVGSGVVATNSGGDVTVTVSGGGGGPTFLTATVSIDWASIGGDLHLDFPVTVTGAIPNDFVVLGLPVGIDGGTVTEAFVSAADVVTIRSHNVIAVAVDQPARTYRVMVIQYP